MNYHNIFWCLGSILVATGSIAMQSSTDSILVTDSADPTVTSFSFGSLLSFLASGYCLGSYPPAWRYLMLLLQDSCTFNDGMFLVPSVVGGLLGMITAIYIVAKILTAAWQLLRSKKSDARYFAPLLLIGYGIGCYSYELVALVILSSFLLILLGLPLVPITVPLAVGSIIHVFSEMGLE